MSLAIIVGYFVSGALATRAAAAGTHPLGVAGAGIAAFILVQAVLAAGPNRLLSLWWGLFGFFGAFSILPYAILPRRFPAQLSGRVVTSLNLLVFSAAFLVQSGVGMVLDAARGPAEGFLIAFAILILLQIFGLAVLLARRFVFLQSHNWEEAG
jgi:MFS family permease